MAKRDQQTNVDRPPSAAALTVFGLASALLALQLGENRPTGMLAFPFVWPDIALVSVLCAFPLAVLLGTRACGPKSRWIAAVTAIAILIAVFPLARPGGQLATDPAWSQMRESGAVVRPLVALGIAWSAVVLCWTMQLLRAEVGTLKPYRFGRWGFFVAVGSAVMVPATYTDSRCRYFESELADSLGQARYGKALDLGSRILLLSPASETNGERLSRVVSQLRTGVNQLEREVETPLTANAPRQQRINRATRLGMLGRASQAREVLRPLVARELPDPVACNLLGTILEGSEDWSAGLTWYEHGKEVWSRVPQSPQQTAGVLQATKGIAYCQRKLGRNRLAEAAYQEALAMSPTADLHFLMAQFYEDTQQGSRAYQHAQSAIDLDPKQFSEPGRQIIDQLLVNQFGCLSVYLNDRIKREAD